MKTIRVGIIGQGRSGRNIHADYLVHDKKFKIMAVVDPIKGRRDDAVATFGCDAYADHKPLLKRDDLDLIVNATPSHLHVPVTMQCLKAGFNVLCEKPLAAKASQVDRLIKQADKSKVTFAIYQQSRFGPYFQQVRKVIQSGVLGRIAQIGICFSGFSRRYDWQTIKDMNGGNLLNTGPHPLDQALCLFGFDRMPNVHCVMDRVTNYGDAEDFVKLVLSGEGRPTIDLEIHSCDPYRQFVYKLCGEKGGLIGDTEKLEWKYYDKKKAPKLKLKREPIAKDDGSPSYCVDDLTWITKTWEVPAESKDLFNSMAADYYNMLYKTLTKGTKLEITPEQVRMQIAVIEKCHKQNPQIYGKK